MHSIGFINLAQQAVLMFEEKNCTYNIRIRLVLQRTNKNGGVQSLEQIQAIYCLVQIPLQLNN